MCGDGFMLMCICVWKAAHVSVGVCMCRNVCEDSCVYTYVEAKGQLWGYVQENCPSPLTFDIRLELVRPPWISLSPPPQLWDYEHMPGILCVYVGQNSY